MTDPRVTMAEAIMEALRYLRLSLACLDEAGEVKAPPYIQMAIEMLEGTDGDDTSPGSSAFRF